MCMTVLGMEPDELALSRGVSPHPPVRVGGWKNVVTARFLIDNLGYKPISHGELALLCIDFLRGRAASMHTA